MALFKEFHVVAGEVENVASKLVMKDIPDFDALLKIESPNALLERLEELAEEVPGDNGDKLSSIVIALKIQAEGRRWIINELRETLDQLRMDLQYVLLDLEATRRESDELAKQ